MPASEQTSKELVRRLRALPLDGGEDDATGRRREVGAALMRAAEDDHHAVRIVDSILRTRRFFPTPVDVWDASEIVEPEGLPGVSRPPAAGCTTCGGTGFRIVSQRGVEGAAVCECRKAP